jgi:hypothetical protein
MEEGRKSIKVKAVVLSHHMSSHQHDFVETAGCGCAARRRQRLATGFAGEECENVNLAERPVLSTVTAACGFARLEASMLQASSYAYPMQIIVRYSAHVQVAAPQ